MEDKRTILIVEDDKYIINFISMSLKKENYRYYAAKSVEEAVSLFYANQPDLIILDLGLPDGDGIEVIERVREKSQIPIIVVSARQEEQEKIRALDMGADDYVTKPFYMGELMARIRVAMRKHIQVPGSQMKEDVFTCDYLSVDNEKRKVFIDEEEIHLTPIEFRILNLLIANRGKVLTHHYIMDEIWGSTEGVESGNLRVFMAGLRRKIEKEPAHPRFILTEVGVGYRFSS
ncbi:response regulator [Murimonas intestini]|uniref:Stage 0 sporulation protein A homolog n=1 Tax=Murimonas intestini TaxID=1337051 RepID=A0AB73T6J7_9FIRM|nr:response regulator [Murimonas intestini]MCR1841420.1 response regulator [Murimonas intestini]MCR1866338.1 response regulator [Murimonas intestini]MCR1882545.1 response regulator [Murimonas intestini]